MPVALNASWNTLPLTKPQGPEKHKGRRHGLRGCRGVGYGSQVSAEDSAWKVKVGPVLGTLG